MALRCLPAALCTVLAFQAEATASGRGTKSTDAQSVARKCTFEDEPHTPYMWDPTCTDEGGDHRGCNADGSHKKCRFCGKEPYPDCPSCEAAEENGTSVVWDNRCVPGNYTTGCAADGLHFECRRCGGEGLDPCEQNSTEARPLSRQCAFAEQPNTSYAWDPHCKDEDSGLQGCKADGVHEECRLCGEAPLDPCPKCEFEIKPNTQVIWDNRCEPSEYVNGCFADGRHFECRFCGGGDYDPCSATTTSPPTTAPETTRAMDAPATTSASGSRTSSTGRGGFLDSAARRQSAALLSSPACLAVSAIAVTWAAGASSTVA